MDSTERSRFGVPRCTLLICVTLFLLITGIVYQGLSSPILSSIDLSCFDKESSSLASTSKQLQKVLGVNQANEKCFLDKGIIIDPNGMRHWMPKEGCAEKHFHYTDIQQCLSKLNHPDIWFVGDSRIRYLYGTFIHRLQRNIRSVSRS